MAAPTSATLTIQRVGPNGTLADLIAALVAATSTGDAWLIQGREIVVVNNGSGGSITVTISTTVGAGNAGVPDGWGVVNSAHDLPSGGLSIAAGKTAILMASTVARFKDSNNLAQITYSAVTSVTVGVFAFGMGA